MEAHGDPLADREDDAGLQVLESEGARAGKRLAIDEDAGWSGPGGKLVTAHRPPQGEGSLTADGGVSDGLRVGASGSAEPGRGPIEFEATPLGDLQQRGGLPNPVEVRMPKQCQGGDQLDRVPTRDQEARQG